MQFYTVGVHKSETDINGRWCKREQVEPLITRYETEIAKQKVLLAHQAKKLLTVITALNAHISTISEQEIYIQLSKDLQND